MEPQSQIILKITNIEWVKSEKKLPKSLDLKWNSNTWSYDQISEWLIDYFKVDIKKFNIEEMKNNIGGG
tara:strand:- start:425 stop:631 length:207 start_codon:yes stop_codon:yes gene_type:complete